MNYHPKYTLWDKLMLLCLGLICYAIALNMVLGVVYGYFYFLGDPR